MLEKFNKYCTGMCCLIGWHAWYEPEIDFFNPINVKEECISCHKRRVRLDKSRSQTR